MLVDYLEKQGINAKIDKDTLTAFQKAGKGDFGTRQINHYPSTMEITGNIQDLLDPYMMHG